MLATPRRPPHARAPRRDGGGARALLLVRRDPGRCMHRSYALRLAPDLLGGWALLREWGRAGSPGRVRSDSFADEAGARAALERLARRKRRKGYA